MTLLVARINIAAINLPALVAYYRDVLGLAQTGGSVESGRVDFATQNLALTLHTGGTLKDGRSAVSLTFGTPSVIDLRTELTARGARIGPVHASGPVHTAEGVDPEGNHFLLSNAGFAQPSEASRVASSTMIWTDTPVATPTPALTTVDSAVLREVQTALSSNPDVFLHTLVGYPGLAIIFRDLLTRVNQPRKTPLTQGQLETILKALGGVGMMGVVGKRHRRIVVFPVGTIVLTGSKAPLPTPMELVSNATYPLG